MWRTKLQIKHLIHVLLNVMYCNLQKQKKMYIILSLVEVKQELSKSYLKAEWTTSIILFQDQEFPFLDNKELLRKVMQGSHISVIWLNVLLIIFNYLHCYKFLVEIKILKNYFQPHPQYLFGMIWPYWNNLFV